MARGGYRANAGRPIGKKNAETIEREMTAAAERMRERGTRSDLAVMLEIRDFWMGVASTEQTRHARALAEYNAKFANVAADQRPEPPKRDDDLMARALNFAGDMAKARSPYLHAKLQPVSIKADPWDLTRLTEDELLTLERIQRKAVPILIEGGTGSTQN